MTNIIEKTCVVCPIGCLMQITIEDNKVTEVKGNTCKRGVTYAVDECTAPKRTLTTTVQVNINGKRALVPVKTTAAIPKEKLFEAMNILNAVVLTNAVKCGDVVIANLLETGIDIVATDYIN